MVEISWEQLARNSESREISFESFNYQVAYAKYSSFGTFEYDYNTPGSEFYLTLYRDCDEFFAKAGDVIGWQAKFWVNHSDMNNTRLDATHRSELIEGFQTSLSYKPKLKTWIICTPGQPANTKPHCAKDTLIKEIQSKRGNINIVFWNKPVYESILFKDIDKYLPIFSHYFSRKYLGFSMFKGHSEKRLRLLLDKFDVDLYTDGNVDNRIYELINIETLFEDALEIISKTNHKIEEIKKNKYFLLSEFNYYPIKFIELIKQLIQYQFGLTSSIYKVISNDKSINTCDELLEFIRSKEDSIKELINSINEQINDEEKLDKSKYDYEEEDCYNFILGSVKSLRGSIGDFISLIDKILIRDVHVFGRAGFGKTSLACSVCNTMLGNNIPALLLLASELRSNSIPIKKQILNNLTIDDSVDFTTLLTSLNNLGFLRKIKIPIIIDGLNETTPTANIWFNELFYLIDDIRKYENLILITTCRESYVEQVFKNSTNYKDVENNLYLEGFDDYNIDIVIERYFKKYNIEIINKDYNKQLLKNPLMLKIFSMINRDKEIVFSQVNIFDTIDTYISNLIDKVSTINNRKNPLLELQVKKGIKILSEKLWSSKTRSLKYPDEFLELFDPDYNGSSDFEKTNSYKVLDEGIFISRKIQGNEEIVEYTFDLLGGFCIAKNIFFNNENTDTILKLITSTDALNNLTNKDPSIQIHPLAEDIIKSTIYLLHKYTGLHIFEIISDDEIIKNVIPMIDVVTHTEDGKLKFYEFIEKLNLDNPAMLQLLNKIIEEVLNNNYKRVDLLVCNILRMSPIQIDLYWSELIRKSLVSLNEYIDDLIEKEDIRMIDVDSILNYLCFIALMLSSTNRLLRDKATKALVLLGHKYLDKFFDMMKIFNKASDLYIIERILGSLVGIIMRTFENELVIKIALFLEEEYIINIRTTHILILDYIDTILSFAENRCNYKRLCAKIDVQSLKLWERDETCLKKIGKDASWGFYPVDMDFSKHNIGNLAMDYYAFEQKNAPSLKDCLAMVIWKIKEYGFTEEKFGFVDGEILKSDKNYRINAPVSTETYGRKYSWLAYFELYGFLMIKEVIKNEIIGSYRVSSVDIDPTFPHKPPKEQLVLDCFLPRFDEEVQMWVNEKKNNYLEKAHIINSEWVLINAYLNQNSDNKQRIDIYVDAILIQTENLESFIKDAEDEEFIDVRPSRYPYIFAGEIPWSKNIYNEENQLTINDKNYYIQHPHMWYNWEQYHSQMNDIGGIPFISKNIAQHLGLTFNVDECTYYTNEKHQASKYIWDNHSHYLYFNKELLKKYCEDNKLSLILYESGTRYGQFGQLEHNVKIPLKHFKIIKHIRL